jgi:hypothetical protein
MSRISSMDLLSRLGGDGVKGSRPTKKDLADAIEACPEEVRRGIKSLNRATARFWRKVRKNEVCVEDIESEKKKRPH